MAQVKKEDVRNAILDAAFSLIYEKGYVGASMVQIARRAHISNANIYIYFDSKIELFLSLYETWLKDKVAQLEVRVEKAATPREKCQVLLHGMFQEMPLLDQGFANNLVQAIATIDPSEPYKAGLREWLEERIDAMLAQSIPDLERSHAKRRRLAGFIVMAFDGCTVNVRINSATLPDKKLIAELTALLLA
ncbi:TetR/AcrR family transcriptional regulator [Pusillimonas sp.]|uniref:TetR/AcrR family transcriptional regulator n=1 Tax=Pusillimonas sp. TaxID=3040095 RepID=UPI0029A5A24C|nr:TetR/AcrR family transcriptional regulator [Pusillimonas sp.]MDX3896186.1 TetR/AcrR family transcriptional regulator [Pusillimonas sp.]